MTALIILLLFARESPLAIAFLPPPRSQGLCAPGRAASPQCLSGIIKNRDEHFCSPLYIRRAILPRGYMPIHDVAPSAVTMAVATDAMICTMNLNVSLLLMVLVS